MFAFPPTVRLLLGVFLTALCLAAPPRLHAGETAPCPGDCDGNGRVTIAELVRGLRIALGLAPLSECQVTDVDGDGRIDIAELSRALNRLLDGCTELPTLTPTMTPSGPPTETPTPSHTPSATGTATGTPPPLIVITSRVCGNGDLEPGEACDDGDRDPGDGCDAFCRVETGIDPCAGVTPVAGRRMTAVQVASGLRGPLLATSPPGDFERVFVVEQRGRIRVLLNDVLLPEPFIDLSSRIVAGGERGLLGLAFHPQYAQNRTFFVSYTTSRNDQTVSIVSRFRVTDDPNVADPNSEELVLELLQPFVTHNGGQLAFDADGYLYHSFGDGGRAAGQQNNAQDMTTWLGKILRLDIDGGTPYAVPAHNPFVGPDGIRDEIWASGMRNPWRFSIDRGTGDVYIGDVGEGRREEINVMLAGEAGTNFGWCCREGTLPFGSCFQAGLTCPTSGLVDPTLEYDHPTGCSVTGGFVYRGCAMPDLHGTYFYGDFCAGFVRSFVLEDGVVTQEHDWTDELTAASGQRLGSISGFGENARGELYVCDLGGRVFKLVPDTSPETSPTPTSTP